MKSLLWLSPYAPYDKVAHAGGKSHNYYVKYFHHTQQYDVTLLSLCQKSEENLLDLDIYGINAQISVIDKYRWQIICKKVVNALSVWNPFDRYAGGCLTYERRTLLREVREYRKKGTAPQYVILQWTFTLLLWRQIKKYFPDAKLIAIEEDVTFLGYERRWKQASSLWRRAFAKIRYQRMNRIELAALRQMDLIVLNNPKDEKLLLENQLPVGKLFTSVPYFHRYDALQRQPNKNMLLFYGAMYRPENYRSVAWFAENVLPLLGQADYLVVAGGNPHQSLYRYKGKNFHLTGFVTDIAPYFEKCLCLLAPLVLGAGIKVKVLEAMSAAVPVLTNEIGIEGIAAADGKEYLHCQTPEEYARAITVLQASPERAAAIGKAAQSLIRRTFDINSKLQELTDRINRL